jgi:hypothetical protein
MVTPDSTPAEQGFHSSTISAQLKRFLWDRGRMQGLFRGC